MMIFIRKSCLLLVLVVTAGFASALLAKVVAEVTESTEELLCDNTISAYQEFLANDVLTNNLLYRALDNNTFSEEAISHLEQYEKSPPFAG